MLSPIPSRILRDTAMFFVPSSIDGYQTASGTNYTVTRVHLQSESSTRKTANNTEVQLRGVLYIDRRHSKPALDYWALQASAHVAGAPGMTCLVIDRNGVNTGPYTVVTVDGLPDDEGRLHHWELSLC